MGVAWKEWDQKSAVPLIEGVPPLLAENADVPFAPGVGSSQVLVGLEWHSQIAQPFSLNKHYPLALATEKRGFGCRPRRFLKIIARKALV